LTPRTLTRPRTGAFQIAVVTVCPRQRISLGVPTFTDSTTPAMPPPGHRRSGPGYAPPFKRLRDVRLVDQVPRSPTGKLLRRTLVEAERAGAGPAPAVL
jgi:acyl-CoA synthetase (AMP-forming)/AMP-acid ligase II